MRYGIKMPGGRLITDEEWISPADVMRSSHGHGVDKMPGTLVQLPDCTAPLPVYTDGSSWQGDGGWAWWVSDDLCDLGSAIDTTNQQMEMLAVLEALETFSTHPVEIISDSAYVINGMTQRWYEKWRVNGWRSSQKKPVANQGLWEALIEAVEAREHALVWTHVRGHRGIEGNEAADQLAGRARKEML